MPAGVYEVNIEQRAADTDELVARDTIGFVVPYPSEYDIVDNAAQVAAGNLNDLAQLGGGKVLSLADPAAAFSHDIVRQPLRVPLWPWLMLAAILLFPVDVATRRISVSWADLRRGRRSGVKLRGV